MNSFAAILSGMVEAPVADITGLAGKYEVTLDTSGDTADGIGRTIFDAVRDPGLRLDASKIQMDLLIIDEIKRTPRPN
jgi:uncharacterized protein (TIGR03435 family)